MSNQKNTFAAWTRYCVLAAFAMLGSVWPQSAATAATYYVRTDGNDSNTGTSPDTSGAWQTVDHATNASLSAGDIVYVMAGTYVKDLDPSISGVSGNPIQFIADRAGTVFGTPGDVILRGDSGLTLDGQALNYVEFYGFIFDGSSSTDDAIFIDNSTGLLLKNCIVRNSSSRGITADGGATFTLINCLIHDNLNDGIRIQNGNATILHCTIDNNGNDGIEQDLGSSTITNSIFTNNAFDGIDIDGGTSVHTYNLVFGNSDFNFEGTSASTGEITADPQYVSSTDRHLRDTSPAVNAATSLSGTVDDDFHGNPRPFNGGVDMGYHEHASTRGSRQLLLVVDNDGYLTAEERDRKTSFEIWGYAVTAIHDSASQSSVDAALALANVVWIAEDVNSGSVDTKFRNATIGVVNEERFIDLDMGFATDQAIESFDTQITITNTDHSITSGLSLGSVAITSSTQPLARSNGTQASGATVLATLGSSNGLIVLEDGAALANTLAGTDTALGRRVRVPWGGNDFTWSSLTSTGLLIAQRALDWASGSALEGHWKLDETSGTTAFDSSGNGNHGTIAGNPSLGVNGIRGYSYDFETIDGIDSIDLGTFDLNGTGVTLAAWVRMEDGFNDGRVIIKSSSNSGPDQLWGLTVDNASRLDFRIRVGGTFAQLDSANGAITPGKWHHVAGTYDQTTMRLYIDGVEVASTNHPVGGPVDQDNSVTVASGASPHGGSRDFDGLLDDLRAYSIALSDTEILQLVGLQGHWKLDETTGTTAVDSSGIGADGTYVNGTALGAAGIRTNAVTLNGVDTDDRIDLPNTVLDGASAVGVAWWMKTTRTGETAIVSGAHAGEDNEFVLAYRDGNNLRPHVDGALVDYSVGALNDGRWHHFVYQHDCVTGVEQIYVDGEIVIDTTRTPTTNTIDIDPTGLVVGQEQDSVGGSFSALQILSGDLDDLWIFDRLLMDAEIAEIYGLIGHWKLDEGSGTVAADSSLAANDGTFQGGAAPGGNGPFPVRGATAATFSGVGGSKVALPTMDYDFSDGLTMVVWYKANALGSGGYTDFFSLSNGSLVDDIWFGLDNNSGLDLFISDTVGGSAHDGLIEGTSPVLGQWRHAVAVIDASGNSTLYHDGVVVRTGTTDLPRLASRSSNGIGETTFSHTLDGLLFDARIYNRPITAEEVAELYGLVGHWSFDEGVGTTIADSTAFSNDASFNTGSPAWIEGIYGSALEFDGTNDATTGANFDPAAHGAVSFWMRSDGTPASRQRPWGIGADFEVWQDTDGLLSFDVSTDGYQGGFITTDRVDDVGRWYHFVGQYDSDTDSYEIYINGELHKSGVSTWNIQQQAANLLTFGTRTGNTQRFTGALDDFRIYNRWLSVAQINELYGRIAYWKLDETSGSVVADATERGNDGTLVASPTLGQPGAFVPETNMAVDLNGSTQYVDTGTSLVSDLPAFTLSGWLRPDGFMDQQSFFGQNDAIEFGISSSNQIQLWTPNGGQVTVSTSLPPGQWSHVTATGDGTNIRVYVNGIEVGVGGNSTSNYGSSTYDFRIGEGVWSGTGDHFDGRLDEVQVYDRALKPEEIFPIYRGGRPPGVRITSWLEVR